MKNIALNAKSAFFEISRLNGNEKNNILKTIKNELIENKNLIIKENIKDVESAKRKEISSAMIDRLLLNDDRIKKMSDSIDEIISLEDPVGEISNIKIRPNGLKIGQMRVPIGVILIIYEARPNVTIDSAVLCIKAGNAVILKGGSESINTNRALVEIIKKSLEKNGLNKNIVSFADTTDRTKINELLKFNDYIDLVIPRGGEGLIRAVVENSRIPVIKHYKGVCHTYIDNEYDKDIYLNIIYNAKVQRPGVCNAMETLLIHQDIAESILPGIKEMYDKSGVELYGCENTLKILKDINAATEEDWYAEYLDLKLAVKIVDNIDSAVSHINKYGSQHSDAIITTNYYKTEKFLREVDSAAVFVNTSTRFSDGGEFGLGAEIGISTDKLHARGPMGIKELTTLKFVVYGSGQIRK
ncbi:glutamate-5-semialdehyde dehydrogenase [Candidatus Dependentiae bacterium]|nr:glutamate-5-semialdehyde dehydrogenase [Candidatus Dependentiae bacterium]